uniref:PX domain-containing protein n=1 Tax=Rhabditophanes sp. KR3021 TaxID=114890 RepID=A0AC35TXY4_9BILA
MILADEDTKHHPLDLGDDLDESEFQDVLDNSLQEKKVESGEGHLMDVDFGSSKVTAKEVVHEKKSITPPPEIAVLNVEESKEARIPSPTEDVSDIHRNHRTEVFTMDTDSDVSLVVDISDALSERDKVKYTVHTKTNWDIFGKGEISVVREHSEFIWLHSVLEENRDYAGLIIPPAPSKPDFDASREKLQKLGEGEATMTKEEFKKMKQELEQEYLATFKKTVAIHEMFLCRLAAHPIFRNDKNFKVFLEYEQDLSVRDKNKKEMVGSFWKKMTQSADEILLSGQKDVDEFFDQEKIHMVEYHNLIREAVSKSDKVAHYRKNVADSYAKIGCGFERFSMLESAAAVNQVTPNVNSKRDVRYIGAFVETLEKLKKVELKVACDEELKEADTLRYFARESQAAKDLLYRRLRLLSNYESANKNLERARAKNKEIPRAEFEQAEACKKFEQITGVSKEELNSLKKRKVEAFKKNLCELVEMEVKHGKSQLTLLQTALAGLKEEVNMIEV